MTNWHGMTKELNLTSDQATQIKPILTDRMQQMEALHQDQSMSQEDKMAKMKSLREDTNTKIEAVLNDTQKQQFAADAGQTATAHGRHHAADSSSR